MIGRLSVLYSTGLDKAALSKVASSIPPETKRVSEYLFLGFTSFSSLSISSFKESMKEEFSMILSCFSSSSLGTSSFSPRLCFTIFLSSGIGSKSGNTRGVFGLPIPDAYSGAGPISSSSILFLSSSKALRFFSSSESCFFLIFSAFASIFSFSI